MPGSRSSDLSAVKGLLVKLIELEDVETAPQVLVPNIQVLLSSNVTLAATELEDELARAGMLPIPEGPDSIAAALDYVLTFLEEVANQLSGMQVRHQALLKDILQGAQQAGAHHDAHGPSSSRAQHDPATELNAVIAENRFQLDSSFLLFLRDERNRLENALREQDPLNEGLADRGTVTLLDLVASVEERVRIELEAMTKRDAEAFAEILHTSHDDGEAPQEQRYLQQLKTAQSVLERRDEYGRQRFRAFLATLVQEIESSSPSQGVAQDIDSSTSASSGEDAHTKEVRALAELIETELLGAENALAPAQEASGLNVDDEEGGEREAENSQFPQDARVVVE